MSEVSTGAGLLPCPFCGGEAEYHSDKGPTGEVYGWVGCNQCDAMSTHCDVRSMQPEETHPIDAWNQRATPEPAGDLVDRVAKAICCEDYPCNAERDGNICVAIENWANEARAAIAAMPDHAAAYEDGYTAGALKWAEAMDKQIVIEETLRAELAASQADVARLRDVLGWYAVQVSGCRKVTSEGNEARYELDSDGGSRARAAIKDTQS